MADDATSRDGNGRFAAGNPGGPGRPKGTGVAALRRAMQGAITPAHIEAVMRKALLLALSGNLAAMKFVADRTCGRPREERADAEPLGVSLPRLRAATDCSRALDIIGDAVCSGTIDHMTARLFVEMVSARVKAIEANEIEQRIAELEKAASSVALQQVPGPRRAR